MSEAIRPADAVRRAAAWLAENTAAPARCPVAVRGAVFAAAWLLGLGGLALLWHGLPTGGDGSALWALTGLAAVLASAAAGLWLALPMTHMETPNGTERVWAAAGLVTTVICAGGAAAVLAFDQLGRVWNGLGL